MEKICKKETQSLVTNEEIVSKVNFGLMDPIVDGDGFYHFIYKTTCLKNGKIYIGVHSTQDLNDRYIGCGIDLPHRIRSTKIGKSHFKNAVLAYGFDNFKREIVLYFRNREEAFIAEEIIVDDKFIQCQDKVLNSTTGGGAPPRRFGDKNGNYGNKWSHEKKQWLSEYFKNTRDNGGCKNPKAKKVVLINFFQPILKPITYSTIVECQKALGLIDIGKFLKDLSHVYNYENIIVNFDLYSEDRVLEILFESQKNMKKNYYKAIIDLLHGGKNEQYIINNYNFEKRQLNKIFNASKKYKEGN